MILDPQNLRSQFPILSRKVNGKDLVYLDNAASSQKPKRVIDAIENYYNKFNANVHRGIHTISQEATVMMEDSRAKVQSFLKAKHPYEIIFTRGCTESINLVAHGMASLVRAGDEILITQMEHHSNIVPWQMLCQKTGAMLKFIPINQDGTLDISKLDELINEKTKLVSIVHVSNALGVVNPVESIIKKAHAVEALVLVDGAQSTPHIKVDLQALDADFYVFSGHKLYAPTGVGILYGKENILDQLPPYMGGGEMIKDVWMDKSTYAELPFKFEAGTPNIEANIVLGDAIDFIKEYGIENFHAHEQNLLKYTQQKLEEIDLLTIYAKNIQKSGAISFNLNVDGVHPSDVGFILDKQGVAVRTGHHCAQPLMNFFGVKGTIRASFACYNNTEDVDKFISALHKAVMMLK